MLLLLLLLSLFSPGAWAEARHNGTLDAPSLEALLAGPGVVAANVTLVLGDCDQLQDVARRQLSVASAEGIVLEELQVCGTACSLLREAAVRGDGSLYTLCSLTLPHGPCVAHRRVQLWPTFPP